MLSVRYGRTGTVLDVVPLRSRHRLPRTVGVRFVVWGFGIVLS